MSRILLIIEFAYLKVQELQTQKGMRKQYRGGTL